MNTKHTPGPWETCHFGERITATYYTKGGTEKVSYEDRTYTRTIEIAQVHTNLGSNVLTEEQKANVKLIAAAPELLEALTTMANRLSRLIQEYEMPTDAEAVIIGEIDAANKAINKATL